MRTKDTNQTHIPEQFEYRQIGYKTGIKLQQRCGLCYGIVNANMIEGGIWKKTGNLVPLSAYKNIDWNIGFKGGNMPNSFDYVIENNGIFSEESNKIENKDQSCQTDKYNKTCERTEIRGIFNLSEGDKDDLAIGLNNYGLVGTGIDISGSDFKQYRSGIYDNINCRSSGISDGVLIVGFGYD
ncbi:MAG: putative cathepsin L1 [Streblomastix strix]|uniref:Putative cathepsin L1 n=1 Tax=Streblomastix strix TaxID=222440 RepID=A0A5J4X0N6_9EUKA|nr:MAG: putative cathepsin L1 [Streblomastix strix]